MHMYACLLLDTHVFVLTECETLAFRRVYLCVMCAKEPHDLGENV